METTRTPRPFAIDDKVTVALYANPEADTLTDHTGRVVGIARRGNQPRVKIELTQSGRVVDVAAGRVVEGWPSHTFPGRGRNPDANMGGC